MIQWVEGYCSDKRIIPSSKSYLHPKSRQQGRRLVISAFNSHVYMRIFWVVDNKRTSEAIAILGCFLNDCIRVSLYVTVASGNLQSCEWYQNVPAWSGTLNWYKKEFPGVIGHWLTPTGPSAQLLFFWNKPCQCWFDQRCDLILECEWYIASDWETYLQCLWLSPSFCLSVD